MEDPGSPAAHFPVLLEIDSKFIEGLRAGVIHFDRDVDSKLVERIDYLVRRFSQGIDLPPEIVTGKADSNHWTAWAIAQDVISSHVGPMAATLCEDLTTGLIWPTLDSLGMGTEDRVQYGVWFDPTDLAVDPDRSKNFKDGFDRFAVSWDSYRQSIGATDQDAPDDKEIAFRHSLGFRVPVPGGARAGTDPNAPAQPIEEPGGEGVPPPEGEGGAGDSGSGAPPG
jgi:hypothetical protein